MKKPDKDTLLLEELLDKYRFARPVPGDVREQILSSKKKNLVRILKTVGAFSALYGVFLTIYFSIKKLAVGVPMAKFIISGMTVAAVSYGGYYAAKTLVSSEKPKTSAAQEKRHPAEENRAIYKWVDQITLYNGRIITGAIISRGDRYKVLTSGGVTYIPRNKIKMVKPLRVEADPESHQTK